MATNSIPEPSQHEVFAICVASGLSMRESARRAGFEPLNSYKIMRLPEVRDRVQELTAQPAERIRAGIEAELLMLRYRAADGDLTPNDIAVIDLRFRLLMGHARFRGWMADPRKPVPRTAGELIAADMQEHLAQFLDALEPGARRDIEARAKAATSKRRPKAKVIDNQDEQAP